jgi:hypothetical protein
MRLFLIIISCTFIFIILYLSWMPEPRISTVWFVPTWLGAWADENVNDNIRTAVPFAFLGIITSLCLLRVKAPSINLWCSAFQWLILLAILAETGQLFIPHRSFDLMDIAWAAAGSLAGLIIPALPLLLTLLVRFTKKKMSPREQTNLFE